MKRTVEDYEAQAQQQLDAAYIATIEDGTAGYHLARAQVYATLAVAAGQNRIADRFDSIVREPLSEEPGAGPELRVRRWAP